MDANFVPNDQELLISIDEDFEEEQDLQCCKVLHKKDLQECISFDFQQKSSAQNSTKKKFQVFSRTNFEIVSKRLLSHNNNRKQRLIPEMGSLEAMIRHKKYYLQLST